MSRSKRAIGRTVNAAVRRQAEEVSETHAALYEWAQRLRRLISKHTGVAIPEVALSIERGRRSRMGWYFVGRDGLQLEGRITINSLYLGLPMCWLLEIVAHECLHFAEELAGEGSNATKSNYHTRYFREHARKLGWPCDRSGVSTINNINPETPFGFLLKKHGVKLIPLHNGNDKKRDTPVASMELPPPKTRAQRWSCSCTNVRAFTKLRARCLKCGERFRRCE